MYKYFENKELLKEIKSNCSGLVKEVEEELRKNGLNSQIFLIGSGAKNMVMQNENESIDFDYNLNVLSYRNIKNCYSIKELVRKSFNKVMEKHGLPDVKDSKSSLTTSKLHLEEYPEIEFSIDLGIVTKDEEGNSYRLIHRKTGYTYKDEYFWNKAPSSKGYSKKADVIKKLSKWEMVRDKYKNLKNHYLKKQDKDHPSFICYIESINNVYNYLKQKGLI